MIHSKEVTIEYLFQKDALDIAQVHHLEISENKRQMFEKGYLSVAEIIAFEQSLI